MSKFNRSNISLHMGDSDAKEYFWGAELNKDKPDVKWTFEEEDDDKDYLVHSLFLKNAILISNKDERNVVQIETKNFDGADIVQPIMALRSGKTETCHLDLCFGNEVPVTFKLIEGSGPVYLSGQELVEYPMDAEAESETEFTATETEELSEEEETEPKEKAPKKRKATSQAAASKKKRGKRESEESGDEDEEEEEEEDEEEDEDEDESMEEDEDSEDEDEKSKGKGKKGKKVVKVSPLKKPASSKTPKSGMEREILHVKRGRGACRESRGSSCTVM